MPRSDYIGLEFDWYARDSDGFLAVFSSAGWGPIPDAVFEKFAEQNLLQKRLYTLCGKASPQNLISDDLVTLTACGLFAFDWKDTYGPYERIAIPERPVSVHDLDLDAGAASELILIPNIHFRTFSSLSSSDIPSFTDAENRL